MLGLVVTPGGTKVESVFPPVLWLTDASVGIPETELSELVFSPADVVISVLPPVALVPLTPVELVASWLELPDSLVTLTGALVDPAVVVFPSEPLLFVEVVASIRTP